MIAKPIEQVVAELLTYVPQHSAEERAAVLGSEMVDAEDPYALYCALAALPERDRARIGFDELAKAPAYGETHAEWFRRSRVTDDGAKHPLYQWDGSRWVCGRAYEESLGPFDGDACGSQGD